MLGVAWQLVIALFIILAQLIILDILPVASRTQSECQQLICDILRATPDAASADAAVQTARLASKNTADDTS
jgi:predicted secreted protein